MQRALSQFENNLLYIRELDVLYLHLSGTLTPIVDLSDILRAELVYLVSALDKLVHELVRIGMIETFNNQRNPTHKFNNFSISLDSLRNIQANSIPPPEYWFEQEVVQKHKLLAFQDPDKISDALSLIWNEPHKWQKIAQSLGILESDVKTQLKTIVGRRNQIVHEADIDILTNDRVLIAHSDITPTIDFIKNLGTVIYDLVK